MNKLHQFVLCGISLILSLSGYRGGAGLPEQKGPLTSDQLQVYGDFVESMSKANFAFLSSETFPLDLTKLDKDAACVRGVDLENPEAARKSRHLLEPQVLRGKSIRLVGTQEESEILKQLDADTAAQTKSSKADSADMKSDLGILALSEVVFDKTRRFAVLKYVFLCGSHCNSGAILVLEKVDSHWLGTTRRPCAFVPTQDVPRS
jgi:hypothetical protein